MRPTERLLERGIPKTDIRAALENWSDNLARWERLWTAAVVGGLAVEVFVSLDRFFPHNIFDLIWPHSSLLGDIGSAMVFVGVFGELVIASKSGRIETALREENAKVISETAERAAKAEQAAAEANLERVKLEKVVRRATHRGLSHDEQMALSDSLSAFAGQSVALRTSEREQGPTLAADWEQIFFFSQLHFVLHLAKWVLDDTLKFNIKVRQGVVIFIDGEGPDIPEAAQAIANGLRKLDVACSFTFGRNAPIPLIIVVGPL
jgi:hypothetical protein